MRILTLVLATVLALCAATALAFADPPARSAATAGISIKDDFFSPSSKSVVKGTTVKWTWRGRDDHDVTVTSGPVRFHSSTKSKGTYSKTLSRTGTYKIVCTIHDGMAMTLRVKKP